VRNVLVARAEAVLEREGIDRMLVRSASAGTFQDLPDLAERARALGTFHASGRLHQLAVAHERAFNLSRNGPHPDVDAAALQHPAEQSLLERLAAVEDTVAAHVRTRDYRAALEGLASLADVVDVFFDRERGVLVMDPDERIRANRLSLLDRTARVFGLVADFSGVIPAELEGEPAAVGARAADATS
jgi:glycyl-tRNA synthetase beta chain